MKHCRLHAYLIAMQAVECYTSRQNSRIQRNGDSSKDESNGSVNDFDEQKQLLSDTLKESNIAIAGYSST